MKSFIRELRWRGMIQDIMPETEQHLMEGLRTIYVGIDPTADSLHIGHLVGVMMLRHFQKCGHKPYALVGGVTGMIGDPSGKSAERNLPTEEVPAHNIKGIQKQLAKLLDFESEAPNRVELVNNYDWMKEFSFLSFIRDIGKYITVDYMMVKDSVKKRFDPNENTDGMSFTEFSYQLLQGYDFLHLYRQKGLALQMGGSDQRGNITTGTEFIRRIAGGKAYALTCPLITKADDTKFGKSESGNVWLDAERTSSYKFYQYWINVPDEDAQRYVKTFAMLSREEIEQLISEHQVAPHLHVLQNKLAEKLTVLVHGREGLQKAQKASQVLFGNSTSDDLRQLDTKTFLEVFGGVPQAEVIRADIAAGLNMIAALSAKTSSIASNSEAKCALKEKSIAVNKEKVEESYIIGKEDIIDDKSVLLQRGRKNYFIIVIV